MCGGNLFEFKVCITYLHFKWGYSSQLCDESVTKCNVEKIQEMGENAAIFAINKLWYLASAIFYSIDVLY